MDQDSPTLRAYIQVQIDHLHRLMETEFAARDKTLALQAAEYERRLNGLNGHVSQTLIERKEFFTRDAHDAFATEYRTFRDSTRQQLTEINTRTVTWGAMLAVAIPVVGILIHMFWK